MTNTENVGFQSYPSVVTSANIPDATIVYADLAAGAAHRTLVVAASDASDKIKATADYVCSGSQDELDINTALALYGNDGGVVQLTAGTYDCPTAVLMNYNNVTLRGVGPATILQKSGAGTQHVIWQQTGAVHDIAVEDLQIDANNIGTESDSNNKGIFINGNSADYSTAYNIALRRLTVHDARAEGICIDYAQYVTIEDCYSYNNSWAGITLAQIKRGTVRGNRCEHNGEYNKDSTLACGINIQMSQYVECFDNVVEDQQNDAAIGVSSSSVSPFDTYDTTDVNVHHNHLIENATGGGLAYTIYAYSSSGDTTLERISIHHNHVYESSGSHFGIRVEDITGFAIHDNFLYGGGPYGIYVHNPADRGYIRNNDIQNYGLALNANASVTDVDWTDVGVVTKAATYTVQLPESGKTFIATKADGAMEFDLPVARIGLTYTFVRGNAGVDNDLTIDPNGNDTIIQLDGTEGTAGYWYGNENDEIGHITLLCVTANKWNVIAESGTWAFETA